MTSQSQFQLFPPAQPQFKPNPFRKAHRRRSTKSPTFSPVAEDTKSPSQTEAVILQIIEDTNMIPPPPPVHISRTVSPSKSIRQTQRAESPQEPVKNLSRSNSPTPVPAPPSERSVSPTTVQTTVIASSPELSSSPPAPMRSIFPQYDPSLSLNQQHYFPQHPQEQHHLPRQVVSKADYNPSITSPPPTNATQAQHEEVPQSIFSSTEDLTQLWRAANAEGMNTDLSIFHLHFSKVDPFTFAFGNNSAALYSFKANAMNDIEIHRSHPTKLHAKSPIVSLNLGDNARMNAGGYVAVLFPMLADIIAREQAHHLSKQHQLLPTEAMEVEDDAVKRAKAQESCVIKWNGIHNRYDLHHQALVREKRSNSQDSTVSPQAPQQDDQAGILHLTISASTSTSRKLQHPPTMLIAAPAPTTDGPESPRTSAEDTPLVALDFETGTLTIYAGLINSIVPSLYGIDTLVSAILTVAVVDQSTRTILADMEIEEPSLAAFPDPYRVASPPPPSVAATSIRFSGKLYTTQAEREEAEQEATLMEQIHSTTQTKSKRRTSFWKWQNSPSSPTTTASPKSKSKNKNKKPPIVVEDIDLERYGRYKDGSSREGQKLPGVTRTVLRTMFWAYKLVIWGLTVAVKFMAWILMNMTRCLTSEKF
ncbi:hypothetical protein AJ80_08242 [Polytolypa hystricis UAMH7299]|uniref:Uncharacterized protein n=1 Tax=Polytolypa hystricis (strain UAMH7299) TaxID=1447883 RepID=A0A2B7X345_POLH7|nr:hypothetical protein AJ80_08242 [Polytolypa hystricis UAMH7299]